MFRISWIPLGIVERDAAVIAQTKSREEVAAGALWLFIPRESPVAAPL
jgi:hypothetical protein